MNREVEFCNRIIEAVEKMNQDNPGKVRLSDVFKHVRGQYQELPINFEYPGVHDAPGHHAFAPEPREIFPGLKDELESLTIKKNPKIESKPGPTEATDVIYKDGIKYYKSSLILSKLRDL